MQLRTPLLTILLLLPAAALAAPSGGGATVDLGRPDLMGAGPDEDATDLHVLYRMDGDARILARAWNGSKLGPVQVAYHAPADADFLRTAEGIPVRAGGGRVKAFLFWTEANAGLLEEHHVVVLDHDGAGWTPHELTFTRPVRPQGSAVGPDGTAYVLVFLDGAATLLVEKDGTWSRVHVGGIPSFSDVAVDAAGTPTVCTSKAGQLVKWTPQGEEILLQGDVDDFWSCRIAFGPDGDMMVAAARLPLIGGSCIINQWCVGMQEGNVMLVLDQDGARTVLDTGLAFWLLPQVGHDTEGRRLLQHYDLDTGRRDVYVLEGHALRRVHGTQDDLVLPVRNLAAPHVLESGWSREEGFRLRLQPLHL